MAAKLICVLPKLVAHGAKSTANFFDRISASFSNASIFKKICVITAVLAVVNLSFVYPPSMLIIPGLLHFLLPHAVTAVAVHAAATAHAIAVMHTVATVSTPVLAGTSSITGILARLRDGKAHAETVTKKTETSPTIQSQTPASPAAQKPTKPETTSPEEKHFTHTLPHI